MNVVSSPALASTFAAAADGGLLCLEGACLFGWAWTLAALTLLSAALVRRWNGGGDGAGGPHLLRVSASASARRSAALLPRLPGVAAQSRAPSVRPVAEPAACASLRAPPHSFERAAVPVPNPADDAPSSPLARRPDGRSPGTPAPPDCPATSGRNPPG